MIGHSAVALLGALVPQHPALAKLQDMVAELDLFDIPTRYPDALMSSTPHRVFTRAQADRALAAARAVLLATQVCIG